MLLRQDVSANNFGVVTASVAAQQTECQGRRRPLGVTKYQWRHHTVVLTVHCTKEGKLLQ
jgi:hypothetical protein